MDGYLTATSRLPHSATQARLRGALAVSRGYARSTAPHCCRASPLGIICASTLLSRQLDLCSGGVWPHGLVIAALLSTLVASRTDPTASIRG